MLPKCYTDICIHGKWFHHDHGQPSAYMLGGNQVYNLGAIPTTEEELLSYLEPIALNCI
ncbi:hypothetical protein GCM10023333_34600 [Ferrimonas pelagia]|uniref:Uncharacterized protein n=1 Tax=Ferrimonas pelagia TaxID=1177826 RepID=A0ABP9FD46_9GAMM